MGIFTEKSPYATYDYVNTISGSIAGQIVTISGINIRDESSPIVGGPHHTINFTGDSVSVYDLGGGVASVWVQPPTFGTWYVWGGDETQTTTNSTTPVQKARLTVANIAAGYYRIGWYYEWLRDSVANDYNARVQIDDTTTIMEQTEESQDPSSWYIEGGFYIAQLTSGNHFIDFDHYGESTFNTSYTRRLRLEMWRAA